MKDCTDLEKKQIQTLCHIMKEKHHKPSIRDIHKIVNDMFHSLHHDTRVNNMCNKEKILELTLRTMFVHNPDHNHHENIIECYHPIIREKFNREQEIEYMNKRRNSCRCTIL